MSPTRRAIVLVDYDNARPGAEETERTYAAFEQNLQIMVTAVCRTVAAVDPSIGELRVRLYGGWVFEDGRWTERAEWARVALRELRGLRDGIRIIPELATATVVAPAVSLRGTARVRRDRKRGYTLQQKMVDTMIAVDLAGLVTAPDEVRIVVSDDDDLVPALVVAAATRGGFLLLRHRALGQSANDHHLSSLGVTISTLGTR